MNRKQLFILIGVLAFACLCLVGLSVAGMAYVGKSFGDAVKNADDPANVKKIASSIADYTTPAGYKEIAMDMFVYKLIMLNPKTDATSSGSPMIMLMSYPPNTNLDEKQMQEQMQRAFAQQSGQNISMHVVETRTVSIRGKDESLTVLEGGAAGKETTMRQWLTIFQGKNGLVMLMVTGNIDEWDEQLINDFIASIK